MFSNPGIKGWRGHLIYSLTTAVSLMVFNACQTSSNTATQTVQQGDQLSNVNDYRKAIVSYKKYLDEAPSQGIYRNYERESDVCRKLAHTYSTQAQYDSSLIYLNQALKLDEETNKDELKVVEDLRLLGMVNTYMGQYAEALRFLNQSLLRTDGMQNSLKESRRVTVADTYISLAHVESAMGNFSQAEQYIDQALAIYEKLSGDQVGLIEANLLKGNILINRNELENALDRINLSKEISEENGLNISRQLQAISEILKIQGELEESLKYKLDALEEAKRVNITPQIIWANLRVGDAYLELGNSEKADEYYLEGLKLQSIQSDTSALLPSIQMRMGELEQAQNFWSRSGSIMGAAIANLKLGESHLANGRVESAHPFFMKARDLFEKAGSDEGTAKASLGMSHQLIAAQDFKGSLELLNQALILSVQPETHWQIWFQKGASFEYSASIDSAIQAYRQSIKIIEQLRGALSIEEFKSSYFEDKSIVYDRLIHLLLEKGGRVNYNNQEISGSQLAFILSERARSRTFLDMLGNQKVNPKSNADSTQMQQEQFLRLKIQQLGQQVQRNNLNGQSMLDLTRELETAQSDYQDLLQRIKLQNPAYQTMVNVEPPDLSSIQSSLNEKTLMIEYWVGNGGVVAWMISKVAITPVRLTATNQEVVRNISALRNAIQFNLPSDIDKALRRLHQQIITPLESDIKKYDNLIFVPHGSLHFLPFQALTDQDGNYLISEKNISYSPSASVYYYTQERTNASNPKTLGLALGDHTIGEHRALPGTAYEVDQIAQFYDEATYRFAQDNTESTFKEDADDFNVIHLATHGILSDKQPLYSYLLMSPSETDDGRLTVQEIMGLNLNANLVTLSACETALGDLNSGDELVGLSRAFLYAGTSAVIVSLWTVDDVSTSVLMTKFHQFMKEGNTPANALSLAQRDMLEEKFNLSDSRGRSLKWNDQIKDVISSENTFRNSPYYWAPFVLIGSDN